jgi:hypothetical protein
MGLTSRVPRIKIEVICLRPRGCGRHDTGKNFGSGNSLGENE